MPLDIKTLCQYRLDRAKEDLLAAENNHQAGLFKAAINRSYYAIFHSKPPSYGFLGRKRPYGHPYYESPKAFIVYER